MTELERLRQARARAEEAWRALEESAGIVLVTGSRRTQIEKAAIRWVNARHQVGRLEKHAREAEATEEAIAACDAVSAGWTKAGGPTP
jgi:hypothetical protein